MVGQDRGVNVAGLLLVKRPHPCLIVVGADDNGQGRFVDAGRFANLRKTFLALNSNQVNRLEVGSGGGHMSSFQNLFQLLRFHLCFLIAAYRHTLLCNRNKIHSTRSFLFFYYEPIKSTIDLIVAPENKTARMHFFGRYFPKR